MVVDRGPRQNSRRPLGYPGRRETTNGRRNMKPQEFCSLLLHEFSMKGFFNEPQHINLAISEIPVWIHYELLGISVRL